MSHLKSIDLESIMQKTELSFKDQLKQFINATGKHLGIALISIITFIITGQIIPESLYVITFVIIPIIVFAVIIYIISYFNHKNKEEMRKDFIALAKSHKNLGDTFTNSIMEIERKLIGRINALETYNPYAIMEFDNATGIILRTNPHFEFIFGWNENTLNREIQKLPIEQRAERLAFLLAERSDQDRLKNEFFSRIAGDIQNKEYKDLYLKGKSGINFPGSLQLAIIHDERGYITQYFSLR
jgi:hypothetical protein